MNEAISTLKTWIEASSRIVFFGGAGVSTESGIKDFRSVDGLYHMKFAYPPETMLSHSFYESHTAEFYDFTGSSSCRRRIFSPTRPISGWRNWSGRESCWQW